MWAARPDPSFRTAQSPATRGIRCAAALGAALVGWLLGAIAVIGFDSLVDAGRSDPGSLLGFVLFIGIFTGLAWLGSVLPLALFGNHDSWFFRPLAAPFVGGACGVILLGLELQVFFGAPPWPFHGGRLDFGEVYLFALAAIIGAAIWAVYTGIIRRQR
jgi:hypothetical protein